MRLAKLVTGLCKAAPKQTHNAMGGVTDEYLILDNP